MYQDTGNQVFQKRRDSHDGLSYLLKIKLATDFGKVSNVRVKENNPM